MLGFVEVEVAIELHLLEGKLLLFGGDRLPGTGLAIQAGLVIEPKQHLAFLDLFTILDQHGLQHATHGHLHDLDIADRLQFAGCDEYLIGFGKGQPGQGRTGGGD